MIKVIIKFDAAHGNKSLNERILQTIINKKMKKLILIITLVFFLGNLIAIPQTDRVYNNEKYTIINPGEKIVLYKILVSPSIKGSKPKYDYYFSKDSLSPVIPLSFKELNNAYADNPAFNELLDFYFKDKDDLIRYDTYDKEYKLSKILELSDSINKKLILTK